jgi:hypothetical protein
MLKLGKQKVEMGPQDGEITGRWDYEVTDQGTKGLQDQGLRGPRGGRGNIAQMEKSLANRVDQQGGVIGFV